MVGILLYAKLPRHCMESSVKKIQGRSGEIEVDIISQGQYEPLNSSGDDNTDLVCNYI